MTESWASHESIRSRNRTGKEDDEDGSISLKKKAESIEQLEVLTVNDEDSLPDDEHANDHTHRTLKNRHIQLIGIGGTIGTALFVSIGSALTKGGPASLFIAFTIWCSFILAVKNCLSEMVTYIPISSPFARYADRWVDPALGFAAGINFFVYQAALIPFDVVAFNVVLQFWTEKIPTAAVICILLVWFLVLNIFTVKYYGESEFWLALGKAILAVGVIIFTFVTMVGGNPLKDVYGFRNWNPDKVAGAPFASYVVEGGVGRLYGFLACLSQASFTIAGPDYISMAAGEAHNPRVNMPKAFHSVFYRLSGFFILGALCVGIVVPYNDPDLINAISNAHPGAGSIPYVIAMQHWKIPVLPHIVNALMLTTVFSAANSYVFCASRTLLGLALEGKAPKVLIRCNRNGVPVYCVAFTLVIALISFLQLGANSAIVMQWFVNLVTASQLLNYAIISFKYLRFYKALKVRGISRDTLPHKGFWQPFCAFYALVGTLVMACIGGFAVFLPGQWDTVTFLFSYLMLAIVPLLFLYYKIRHHKWQPLSTMTFFEKERREIDLYEEKLKE